MIDAETGRLGPVRVVVAPDKFRGSLTAAAAARAMSKGIRSQIPDCSVVEVPMADGGEGTLEALEAAGFRVRGPVLVHGPYGRRVQARWVRRGPIAVVQAAEAVGRRAVGSDRLRAPDATTRGVGELISAALEPGVREVVVSLGGSVTTDGGAGMLAALGVEIADALGRPVGDGGAALEHAASVSVARVDPRLRAVRIVGAVDVTNPLLGPDGAARLFAPQKGASPVEVDQLERALSHFADVVAGSLGRDARALAGAGAAGGTGFALAGVLDAMLVSGASLVGELTGCWSALDGASLVVTGEGSLDAQSLLGKVPIEVARRARAAHVPCVAIVGRCELEAADLAEAGLGEVVALVDWANDATEAQRRAAALIAMLSARLARRWCG
ncbi:glycerate kinase [Acidimicrobium ferrooxidans DSM 10331]|uniref:Glycerate kinase n=1 Tax=Acidimicrobium ferrooxidans (strain DSM 10331 / JCM 15462 / NBRC 103882 / ICP) TaxID=525909 RepID=C7M3D2_ACIFD|nr:glycerate kinase [Acidimicrobium ferrooxidans]ACU53526.1 glycerate kinase [Acidimicrobium ferrooxidans DSM 10331]